jgi:cytochrome P450
MMFHRGFSRKLISTYEPLIRDICNDILDEAVDLSEIDATKEIAKKITNENARSCYRNSR